MGLCNYSIISILRYWWTIKLSNITRLKTLLLKCNEFTIDLKYHKCSEMHTSDALNRLHNLMNTPDNKDVIPLNFLQHFTPNYIECAYSHWVENHFVHKTKEFDTQKLKENVVDHLNQN